MTSFAIDTILVSNAVVFNHRMPLLYCANVSIANRVRLGTFRGCCLKGRVSLHVEQRPERLISRV